MCPNETLDTRSLEEITKRLEDLLKPLVADVLRRPLAEPASNLVKEAVDVLRSLSPKAARSLDNDDELAVSESLTDYLGRNLARPDDAVQEKVLHHHVVEAADIVATTWLDILDQACAEADDGRLELDGDSMLPGENTHHEMHQLISEALLSSVISEKEFRRALCALRQALFSGRTSVELPLGLCLHFDRGRLVVERHAERA